MVTYTVIDNICGDEYDLDESFVRHFTREGARNYVEEIVTDHIEMGRTEGTLFTVVEIDNPWRVEIIIGDDVVASVEEG